MRLLGGEGIERGARGNYRTRSDKRFCSKNFAQKRRYHDALRPQRHADSEAQASGFSLPSPARSAAPAHHYATEQRTL